MFPGIDLAGCRLDAKTVLSPVFHGSKVSMIGNGRAVLIRNGNQTPLQNLSGQTGRTEEMPVTSRPKYSVLIPTRNRAQYLIYAIRSCLHDKRTDIEIVISDNSDPNEVGKVTSVIDSLQSTQIRYVRPASSPVAMSVNWEHALSHASGDYVTIIGDDDAILPSAFSVADAIVAKGGRPAAFGWPWVYYMWPDYPVDSQANRLMIPLSDADSRLKYDEFKSLSMIRRVMRRRMAHTCLPMLYNSFVRRDVVGRINSLPPPRLASAAPDVYSGFLVALLARNYFMLRTPLTINGQSTSGNYAAMSGTTTGQTVVANDFVALNARSGREFHPSVPLVPSPFACVVDSFERVKSLHDFPVQGISVTRQQTARIVATEIATLVQNGEARARHVARVLDHYSDDRQLYKFLVRIFQRTKPNTEPIANLGLKNGHLYLNAKHFSITNVYEASLFVSSLLSHDTNLELFVSAAQARDFKSFLRDITPPLAVRLYRYFNL